MAFQVPLRRPVVIQDLHGPWGEGGALWAAPYDHPVAGDAFEVAVALPEPSAEPVALWWHGELVAVDSAARRDALGERYGAHRVAGAAVGPVPRLQVPAGDRQLVAAFCARGWLRLLVRAFYAVGCKAPHVGQATQAALEGYGPAGVAVWRGRGHHRLAALELLLRELDGDPEAAFVAVDALDRALDAAGQGSSWLIQTVPEHARALFPLRNLLRLAERRGVILREMTWREYEAEDSYAPEIALLCLDPEIYGAGVEHDVTHFIAPVLFARDVLTFEVGNNGIEGDAQAMNNLILACHHSGPAYEGAAGWPGAPLFEWLERAFGVGSLPGIIAALRTFTVALHERFEGDPEVALAELVPALGDEAARRDLVTFFRGYVQHDHAFLRSLHPRYLTPIFAEWRRWFGDRVCDDMRELVARANAVLWELEDLDLRTWDHPLQGQIGSSRERARYLCFKLVELRQLLALREAAGEHDHGRRAAQDLFSDALALERELGALSARCAAATAQVPPASRDAGELARIDERLGRHDAAREELAGRLDRLVRDVRQDGEGLADPVIEVPADFATSHAELFRGYYYEPPAHFGDDHGPGDKRLSGAGGP